MPMPRWLARVNKRVFNPMELKRGKRPVLTHVGRSSGKTRRTPLDAHAIDGGFLFIANYGPESDWIKNILASGSAILDVQGVSHDLTNPRLLHGDDGRRLLPEGKKTPPGVSDFLVMDTKH